MIRAFDTETDKGLAILITKPDSFLEPEDWHDAVDYIGMDRETACYNMDYDVQAILKFLSPRILDRIALLNRAEFYVGPVAYELRYVPHKFCKIWREGRLLTTVYDMAQFYNCSLARALEKLGLPPKKELPESWYTQMKARLRDPATRQQVLEYAINDAARLQDLIDATVTAFARAGMKFERPFSNASFSQRVFDKALTRKGVTRHVDRIARIAYFGGRIECLRIGYFPEAYYYDIHSAYPSVIATLLSPNGRWIEDKRIRDDAIYAFVDCTLEIGDTVTAGPVAVRLRSNRIVYPAGKFRRILTLTEYRFCEQHGYISKVHSAVQHIWPKRDVYPFQKVRDLYLQRQKNPAQSYAIKIVLNAVYGKTAQMLTERLPSTFVDQHTEWIGSRPFKKKEKSKRFTNFVFASEITARIRTRLIRDIPPDQVIFYATDGVMCTAPIGGLDIGDGLGQWSVAERVTDLIVIGSGVYQYTDSEGKRVTKFRGFAPSKFNLQEMLKKAGKHRVIPVRVLRNTSLRQAVQRPEDFNILEKVQRKLDLNFDRKRSWPGKRNAKDLLRKQFVSEPLIYYGTLKLERRP